jgi:hypothetical protein
MCLNCGCQIPDDDMGQGNAGVDPDGKSITTSTIQAAADSQNMTLLDSMKNMRDLLNQMIEDEENK